ETGLGAVRPRSSRKGGGRLVSLRREPGALSYRGGRDREEEAMAAIRCPQDGRGHRVLGWVLVLAIGLGACSSGPSGSASSPSSSPKASFPLTMTDDDGVAVSFPALPKRIVTFAPSNTEIVFALGLGSEVVGVSGAFDNYPPQAKEIAEVGGSGEFGVDPNAERVVALHPDLMLTISGGDQWKDRLR